MKLRLLISLTWVSVCAVPAVADPASRAQALAMFGKVDAATEAAVNAPQAQLGRALYWDTRASADGKTACASCHAADSWSSDVRKLSVDARGKFTSRHSQPIFNSMMQPHLRWTGDRANGAAQAEGSLTGSMGFETKEAAVARLKELGYAEVFKNVFPADAEPVSARNYAQAIQAYETTLTNPAPFDKFLAGNDAALNPQQKRGLTAFVSNGCVACHSGPLLGGAAFQKFGLVKPYWEATKSEKMDLGRFENTKLEADKSVFRVAMLRNVTKTAPYFHDGSVAKLEDAVRIMGEVQMGKTIPEADIKDIVAFLASLAGEIPKNYSAPAEFVKAAK